MLRRLTHEEAPTPSVAPTPEELTEAVSLLRQQRAEAELRDRESAAYSAALAELGEEVSPSELLEAVEAVRRRRVHRGTKSPRRGRLFGALTALFVAGSVSLWVFGTARLQTATELHAREAMEAAQAVPTGPGAGAADLDGDGSPDVVISNEKSGATEVNPNRDHSPLKGEASGPLH